jgi:hypothetical protein
MWHDVSVEVWVRDCVVGVVVEVSVAVVELDSVSEVEPVMVVLETVMVDEIVVVSVDVVLSAQKPQAKSHRCMPGHVGQYTRSQESSVMLHTFRQSAYLKHVVVVAVAEVDVVSVPEVLEAVVCVV